MEKIPISVVIITKNEEQNLPACLESVRWAKEIVIVDDESTDRTFEIARAYTDKIFIRQMDVEGKQRNFALAQATQGWILILDADERASPELEEELTQVVARDGVFAGYAIPIRTLLGRRWIKAAGYYPATRMRFFRRDYLRYEETGVHPRVFLNGKRAFLRGEIIHYGYRNVTHFIDKLNHQTTLEARKWVEDGRYVSWFKILFKMCERFCRNYFGKKGITDGFLGFLMSAFHSIYQFFTYEKYLELKRSER